MTENLSQLNAPILETEPPQMGFLLKTRVRTLVNRLLMIQYRAVSLFFRLDVPVEPNWYLSCLSSCLSFLVKVESHIWVVVRIRAWILANQLSENINKQTEIWTKSSHQIITRQTVYVVLYSDCLNDNKVIRRLSYQLR